MDKIESFRKALQGKKTYFTLLIGVLYLVGVWAEIFSWDPKVAAALGLTSLWFMRAALSRLGVQLLLLAVAGLALTGCARFHTKQTDINYDQGKPSRSITTSASAYTFFSSKSQLANWKAEQTDSAQGATVGSLTQEGGQTNNLSDIVGAVIEAAVRAAK